MGLGFRVQVRPGVQAFSFEQLCSPGTPMHHRCLNRRKGGRGETIGHLVGPGATKRFHWLTVRGDRGWYESPVFSLFDPLTRFCLSSETKPLSNFRPFPVGTTQIWFDVRENQHPRLWHRILWQVMSSTGPPRKDISAAPCGPSDDPQLGLRGCFLGGWMGLESVSKL